MKHQTATRFKPELRETLPEIRPNLSRLSVFDCEFCENDRISLCGTQCIACWELDDD